MNLVIDIGNTFTKFAVIEGENIILVDRFKYLPMEIIDKAIASYSPTKAIISSVGKENKDLIKHLMNIIPTTIFRSSTSVPIKNLYKTPQTLGLDRVAAVVGASCIYPSTDILVIDCGTAITYDFLDCKSQYYGGAISPGIELRFKSLHQHTAKLPLMNCVEDFPFIGTSTSECIESGVLNGVIGEIDHYINHVKDNVSSIKVIVTGGDADFFVNKLKNSIFVVQNLVLIGLNRILDFNAKL